MTGAGDNSDEDVYNPSLLNGKVCRKSQRSKQAGAKQCGSNYDNRKYRPPGGLVVISMVMIITNSCSALLCPGYYYHLILSTTL